MVAGRRMFDIAHAWGGNPPGGGPCIIMTHNPPEEWLYEGSPFTFITDGIESAIQEARRQAGDGAVGLSSASVMQQALKVGLLDEVRIDLAPVLIGGGVRLFEAFGDAPIELEQTTVIEGKGVTHLRYQVKPPLFPPLFPFPPFFFFYPSSLYTSTAAERLHRLSVLSGWDDDSTAFPNFAFTYSGFQD